MSVPVAWYPAVAGPGRLGYDGGVTGEGAQAEKNARAYRRGVNDAREGRNFGRPDREYPTEEERISYRMGFYNELEALEEQALDEERLD